MLFSSTIVIMYVVSYKMPPLYDLYVCMYVGAKNHATVMPDADREQTVNAIVGAAFGAAGQRWVFMYVCYMYVCMYVCMHVCSVCICGSTCTNCCITKLSPLAGVWRCPQ